MLGVFHRMREERLACMSSPAPKRAIGSWPRSLMTKSGKCGKHVAPRCDLAAQAGNRLEALKGDRLGQYSIRISDQQRRLIIRTYRRSIFWHAAGRERRNGGRVNDRARGCSRSIRDDGERKEFAYFPCDGKWFRDGCSTGYSWRHGRQSCSTGTNIPDRYSDSLRH